MAGHVSGWGGKPKVQAGRLNRLCYVRNRSVWIWFYWQLQYKTWNSGKQYLVDAQLSALSLALVSKTLALGWDEFPPQCWTPTGCPVWFLSTLNKTPRTLAETLFFIFSWVPKKFHVNYCAFTQLAQTLKNQILSRPCKRASWVVWAIPVQTLMMAEPEPGFKDVQETLSCWADPRPWVVQVCFAGVSVCKWGLQTFPTQTTAALWRTAASKKSSVGWAAPASVRAMLGHVLCVPSAARWKLPAVLHKSLESRAQAYCLQSV